MGIIIRLLNFLTALGCSAAFIWHNFDAAGAAAFYAKIQPQMERFFLPMAIVIVVLNVYGLLAAVVRRLQRRQDIEISGGDGVSIVSIAAVERRMLDLTTKFSDIRQARVTLKIKKKDAPIHCSLVFGLAREHDITGRIEEIKRCLHNAFQKLLPGATGLDIHARVVELRDEETRTPTNEDTFIGPVYPVHEQGNSGEEDER